MTAHLTVDQVEWALKGLGTGRQVRANRVRFTTTAERLREAVGRTLKDLSCDHFIQLGSVDTGTDIELHYHLTGPHRTVVTLTVPLPRDAASVPTVSDLLAPAGLYERQVHDLMGVDFRGHPDLKRFILNEDWPEGEYPMRKDWKPAEGTFYGGVREAPAGKAAPAGGAAPGKEGQPCPR